MDVPSRAEKTQTFVDRREAILIEQKKSSMEEAQNSAKMNVNLEFEKGTIPHVNILTM
jgi:hypothetical protein